MRAIACSDRGRRSVNCSIGFLMNLYRDIGFLKCYYMAGNIVSLAGYFDFPAGGFTPLFNVDDNKAKLTWVDRQEL